MAAPRRLLPLRWSFPTHGQVSTLGLASGLLIAPVRRSQVAAMEATTGAERWRARHLNVQWQELVPTGGQVFMLGGFEQLTALDVGTGTRLWQREVPRFSGWLHAVGSHLLYGGWRGYTPLHGADAQTGEVRWQHALGEVPARTSVYAPLDAAAVVMPGGRVTFLRLHDGRVQHEVALPGLRQQVWPDAVPREAVGLPGTSFLLPGEGSRMYRLVGESVTVETRHLGRVPLTRTLRDRAGEVFFQDEGRRLCVYSLERDETTVLGPLRHNRSDLLPVLRLPDRTVLAGTSFGQLVRFAPEGGVLGRRTVGKRILTELQRVGELVCFGTQGGTVAAWPWRTALEG